MFYKLLIVNSMSSNKERIFFLSSLCCVVFKATQTFENIFQLVKQHFYWLFPNVNDWKSVLCVSLSSKAISTLTSDKVKKVDWMASTIERQRWKRLHRNQSQTHEKAAEYVWMRVVRIVSTEVAIDDSIYRLSSMKHKKNSKKIQFLVSINVDDDDANSPLLNECFQCSDAINYHAMSSSLSMHSPKFLLM